MSIAFITANNQELDSRFLSFALQNHIDVSTMYQMFSRLVLSFAYMQVWSVSVL